MSEFIMLNWHHFDLNYIIIHKLKQRIQKNNNSYKKNTKSRMDMDFQLKIKKD